MRFKNGGSYFLEDATFNVLRHQQLKADGFPKQTDTTAMETLLASSDESGLERMHLEWVREATLSCRKLTSGSQGFMR